jgi:phosphonate transport system substrate-binding protein
MFLSRMLLGLLLTISFVQTLQAAPFMVKFGFINERPDEPDHVLKINGSFVQYLNQKLAQHQSSAEIVIAKNLDDMVQKIQRGDINVVGESLFATFKLTDQAQMQPLVLAWRKGVRSYETLFVVRQDSAIQKLADLVGKTIVFESPRSTSAYAVPKAFLLSKNMKVMPASQNNLPPDTIKYIFSGDKSTQAWEGALRYR